MWMSETVSRGFDMIGLDMAEIDVAHLRIGLHLGGRPFRHHPPTIHYRDAVGQAERHVHIVLDQHHGDLARQRTDHFEDALPFAGRETRARLVEEQHAGMGAERQRQLELALALGTHPRVLYLDEPCAGLSPSERQRIFKMVRALPREITVVLIEHDMDVALGLADRVTVMNRGRVMTEGTPAEVQSDPQVRDVYFGHI